MADALSLIEDHLDMHFRQNCKANQSLGRGHSRSWFVNLDVQLPIFDGALGAGDDH
jgi:outer membrane protein TolC